MQNQLNDTEKTAAFLPSIPVLTSIPTSDLGPYHLTPFPAALRPLLRPLHSPRPLANVICIQNPQLHDLERGRPYWLALPSCIESGNKALEKIMERGRVFGLITFRYH